MFSQNHLKKQKIIKKNLESKIKVLGTKLYRNKNMYNRVKED